jgi:deoxyribodipyrimidine photo-lyase
MNSRARVLNDGPLDSAGSYVLYWMTGSRRAGWNHALDHAVALCRTLRRPLLVLEPLRCDYRWATERSHRFVIEGMQYNAEQFGRRGVTYYPYVEPAADAGRGLLEALAAHASVVIADDSPAFFLPRMVQSAADRLTVRMEAVDSVGVMPVRSAPRAFAAAVAFRRWLQGAFDADDSPAAEPLADGEALRGAVIPTAIETRWPPARLQALLSAGGLAGLPLDDEVGAVAGSPGGTGEAERRLRRFLDRALPGYAESRNDPAAPSSSGLSAHLHYGHISTWQILSAVADSESWSPQRLSRRATGAREGWWGMSRDAESFLDQLVVWRELGHNTAALLPDYESYSSLPEWARATLADHAADPRDALYGREQLEAGLTDDALWNATQQQLREEGVIQGYLRMLWGKRILTWTRDGEEAFELMLELNNRWALDGRDPNSTSGIAWVLGRYDRPWPERQLFGRVRAMTSRSTARKLNVKPYLARWGRTPLGL